ncbi:MAG: hypothetical protein V4643_04425 [Bacteroidota bacterium]
MVQHKVYCITKDAMAQNLLILLDDNDNTEALIEQSKSMFNAGTITSSTGVFVDGISHHDIGNLFNNSVNEVSQYEYDELISKILHNNPLNSQETIERVIRKCKLLSLKIDVFFEKANLLATSFVVESKYSDTLIIGKEIITKNLDSKEGADNIYQLLTTCQCPILLIPSKELIIEHVVLLFDGSLDSFQTIKLFVYLMGAQIKQASVHLIIKATSQALDEERYLIAYIKSYCLHFSISRIYLEAFQHDLLMLLNTYHHFLLVAGHNKEDIIYDLMKDKESYFLKEGNSVFMA